MGMRFGLGLGLWMGLGLAGWGIGIWIGSVTMSVVRVSLAGQNGRNIRADDQGQNAKKNCVVC